MTDAPKPPEGYPGWLETIIWCQGSSKENRLARAELAELRAYKTAYLEAMKIVSGVQMAFNRGDSRRETLFRFVQTEIESGRFKP